MTLKTVAILGGGIGGIVAGDDLRRIGRSVRRRRLGLPPGAPNSLGVY